MESLASQSGSTADFIESHPFASIRLGDRASLIRRLTERDIELCVALSGDGNPAQLDSLSAETRHFHETVATSMLISHVFVLDVPRCPKPLLITDAAINIAPDFDTKVETVQNAIDPAHVLGIKLPKVAILSAVEAVTSRLRSSMDAAELSKMADRGQITGGLVDGPLAFDNAESLAKAQA